MSYGVLKLQNIDMILVFVINLYDDTSQYLPKTVL